jgi:dimethylhistidine N-methyltransferase
MYQRASVPEVLDFGSPKASFRDDLFRGLQQLPKSIPSKYFYDERGAELFERICETPEYYPTRTELEITRSHAEEMAACLGERCLLVEYGSGASLKSRILLDHLDQPAGYVPIDISREQLGRTAKILHGIYPHLEVLPVCADYTSDYALPTPKRSQRHVSVYFPGSTIGNFTRPHAAEFLEHVAEISGAGGGLLLGVDLQKDRQTLERAYNDAAGVTEAFNKNLLVRANRELGADFRPERFRHVAFYDEDEGRIEMHLESAVDQAVRIGERVVPLAAGERIHTENSYKYRLGQFADLAQGAGWSVVACWTDPERLFSVQYLEVDPV